MVIKSRNVRCERHVARMDEISKANKILVGRSKKNGTILVPKKNYKTEVCLMYYKLPNSFIYDYRFFIVTLYNFTQPLRTLTKVL
jgi:hypothetical protein